MIHKNSALGLLLAACAALPASAADWMFEQSTYSHNPRTGERVTQYAQPKPVYIHERPDYLQSGYRHNRTSIVTPLGSDHLHVVEEWGRPVRPYGEWQYPYRPYSVPYHLWGPQPGWGWFGQFGPHAQPFGAMGGAPQGPWLEDEWIQDQRLRREFLEEKLDVLKFHPHFLHSPKGKPGTGGPPGHPKHEHPKHGHPKHGHPFHDPGFGAT